MPALREYLLFSQKFREKNVKEFFWPDGFEFEDGGRVEVVYVGHVQEVPHLLEGV